MAISRLSLTRAGGEESCRPRGMRYGPILRSVPTKSKGISGRGRTIFSKANFAKSLSDLDSQLNELRSYRDGRVEISADLNNLTTELRTLIGQMHYGGFPGQT